MPVEALQDIKLAKQDIRQGQLQRSMALIAGFSAIVSGFESYTQHERGHFSNRMMWTPVWLMPFVVVASTAAIVSKRAAKTLLPFFSLASLVDGLAGFVYHHRGIARLPGGLGIRRG